MFCICMLSAGAACVCSLDVTPLIGSQFACMAGLQEKDVHGNAKFRLTPLTRAQMHTKLIATGFCIRLSFWNGCACDGLKVITATCI